MASDVFITGGTGYIGRALIPALIARGHRVRALARPGSTSRVPVGAEVIVGDALDAKSIAAFLRASDTVIHLVGTPHPNPAKAGEFFSVDLVAARAAIAASQHAGVRHFVYLSVAQPAPIMRAYIDARMAGEQTLRASGVAGTILRPWYVLGPRHWWPMVMVPVYAIARHIPPLRAGALRLGLVTLPEMVQALVYTVETPPARESIRVLGVPEILVVSRQPL